MLCSKDRASPRKNTARPPSQAAGGHSPRRGAIPERGSGSDTAGGGASPAAIPEGERRPDTGGGGVSPAATRASRRKQEMRREIEHSVGAGVVDAETFVALARKLLPSLPEQQVRMHVSISISIYTYMYVIHICM